MRRLYQWRRLSEYGELAGIGNKRDLPHEFRHTAALLYILNRCNPFSLQKRLVHSDVYGGKEIHSMDDVVAL